MRLKRCLLICFVTFIMPLYIEAQQRSSQASEKGKITTQQSPGSIWDIPNMHWDAKLPFDATLPRLPQGYTGHNIISLYKRLEAIDIKKDEFETSTQYAKRIQVAAGDGLFAFWKSDEKMFSYNADDQKMLVNIPSERVHSYDIYFDIAKSINSKEFFTIEVIPDMKTSYYYGTVRKITRKVTKEVFEDYKLVVSEDRMGDASKRLQFSIPMKSEYARTVKQKLNLLLVCRLSSHLDEQRLTFAESEALTQPTLTNPREMNLVKRHINVELQEVWVYDYVTGEVLEKHIVEEPSFTCSSSGCLTKFRFERLDIQEGDVVDNIWRIDAIGRQAVMRERVVEVTNLRSGIRYQLGRNRIMSIER